MVVGCCDRCLLVFCSLCCLFFGWVLDFSFFSFFGSLVLGRCSQFFSILNVDCCVIYSLILVYNVRTFSPRCIHYFSTLPCLIVEFRVPAYLYNCLNGVKLLFVGWLYDVLWLVLCGFALCWVPLCWRDASMVLYYPEGNRRGGGLIVGWLVLLIVVWCSLWLSLH